MLLLYFCPFYIHGIVVLRVIKISLYNLIFNDALWLSSSFFFYISIVTQVRISSCLNLILFGVMMYLPFSLTPWPLIWLYDKVIWFSDPLLMFAEVSAISKNIIAKSGWIKWWRAIIVNNYCRLKFISRILFWQRIDKFKS